MQVRDGAERVGYAQGKTDDLKFHLHFRFPIAKRYLAPGATGRKKKAQINPPSAVSF